MNSKEAIRKSAHSLWQKWAIVYRVIPFIVIIAILKFVAHNFGLELMELNALFTSLVAGTIFIIGFLVSGVLSDYKEAEKIPGELTASLKTMFDDTYTILKGKNSPTAQKFLEFQNSLVGSILDWFYKKERTKTILAKLNEINDFLVQLENEGIQANYIIKLKNEQNIIRRIILRIDTIRDTEFVGSAYAILEAMGVLIAIGLIIIDIEPFYASLFFTLLVTFLIVYMFFLISDLDNPFDYSVKGERGTEISLKLIREHKEFLETQI